MTRGVLWLDPSGRWSADEGGPYQDLQGPSVGINPPGGAADPSRNTTTGLLEFSGVADNILAGEWQFTHGTDFSRPLNPHVHLQFPAGAAGTVSRWRFDYNYAGVTQSFSAGAPGNYTTLSTQSGVNPGDPTKHQLVAFGPLALPFAGSYGDSAIVLWRLTRLANTDAADNLAELVALLYIDCHYVVGRVGSLAEIPGA